KAALQEQLRDQFSDITSLFIQIMMLGANDTAKGKIEELFAKLKEVMPKALLANGSSISAENSELTYIDFCVYSFFKVMMPHCIEKIPEYLDSFKALWSPEVIKIVSSINADPRLQSRVAEDKKIFTFLA
ncbi:hypothetical protein EV175_007536, partial [Coemansia sp. RSA 1933]